MASSRRGATAWLFLSPALFLLAAFFVWPTLQSWKDRFIN